MAHPSELKGPIDLTTQHVRGAVGGDADSVCWLVERFAPLLYAVAAHRLGPRLRESYDPTDVVQDVWTAVLPRLGTLDLRGARTTPVVLKYLTMAVVNRVRTLLRKHLARQLAGESDDTGLEDLVDPASGVMTKAVRAESAARVHRALDDLSESDREIVILRGIEQQPLLDVAERLGVAANTASVRFRRALKRLQRQLPDSVFGELEPLDA